MQKSVIIPVIDEERTIGETIRRLRENASMHDVEIIVVDGHSSGNTIRTLRDHHVTKIVAYRGRAVQMNTGAAVARGDVLLFLHADTILPANAFDRIDDILNKKNVAGGAFDLGIASGKSIYRVIETISSFRSRITRIPYGDQGIFVRREIFEMLGGYKEMPIMEDVDLMRRIKAAGFRISFIPERVRTSPRRWEKDGVVFCTARNWMLIILYLCGVSTEKLVRFYR